MAMTFAGPYGEVQVPTTGWPVVRVLICDDEPDIRTLYRTAFEMLDAVVSEASDGAEALVVVGDDPPDLVVLDLFMPGRDGLSVLPELRTLVGEAPILVVSAHAAVEVFAESRSRGATACFDKLGFHQRIPAVVARFSPTAA